MKRLVLIWTIAAGAAMLQMAIAQTKPGDVANGKRLFERDGCYQCHGWQGQGGTAGARLAQTRLALPAFIGYVRNPNSGGMPPFRQKVLSDRELADIYAYIKTFPEPKPVKDIPLLNQ
jgi:ubiquinol-cytochrome c reductase cytochrome c subunit